MYRNVVSGARISSGGLHLGHFLGCIQPLITSKEKIENYIFVLNSCDKILNKNTLVEMLLDLYAIRNRYGLSNFHVIIDEEYLTEYDDLLKLLRNEVSLKELLKVYPRISDCSYIDATVEDFLFPLKQAMSYYIFDADTVFLNNDNLRFVEFSAKIAKKINKSEKANILCCPKLITGKEPRLLGYNYLKMCKKNNNSIFLSDDVNVLKKKIYKLFDMAQLFEKYPDELVNFKENIPYMLPKSFLPFQYISSFSLMNVEEINFDFDYKDSRNRALLREYLTDLLFDIIIPIQEERSALTTEMVLQNLEHDKKYLKTIQKSINLKSETKITL